MDKKCHTDLSYFIESQLCLLLCSYFIRKYFDHIPKEKSDSECFHKGNYCQFFNI